MPTYRPIFKARLNARIVHTADYSQKYVFRLKLLRQTFFLPRRNRTPKFDTPDVRTPDSGTLTGALPFSLHGRRPELLKFTGAD